MGEIRNEKVSATEQAAIWIHEHPTVVKVAEAAALVLGVAMVAAAPFVPVLGATVALAVGGAILVVAATAALLALDILIPPHHDMSEHVFPEAEFAGGKLYYEGDVPILSLDMDNPFEAGKAQGYLCGDAINRVVSRFDLLLHTLAGRPRADQLPKTMEEMRKVIPEEYLKEMEGLAEGYNKWVEEQLFSCMHKKITADDILLLHLLPDGLHFAPQEFEEGKPKEAGALPLAACTSIVDEDLVFARNMDWPSFGIAGTYTLVIHRKHKDKHSTVEVAPPGFVGAITGMNSAGLALSMNVCNGETNEIRGMPAVFHNRYALEHCSTVGDVERLQSGPLGPYHMTVADSKEAIAIHFYQAEGENHTIRRVTEDTPVFSLNCRYTPEPVDHVHYGYKRTRHLREFFEEREGRPLEEALALPYVNNWLTTHRVMMEPGKKSMRVAFDNAFAGKAPLHTVPIATLFALRK